MPMIKIDQVPWYVRQQMGIRQREKLSERETEIVNLILSGHVTYQMIADKIDRSPRTVQTHLEHIYQKTDSINMAELVLKAINGQVHMDGG